MARNHKERWRIHSSSSSSSSDSETEPIQSLRRSEDFEEELLPGIPNDVTLDQIAGKLSWKDLQTLSLVSHAWHKASRSPLVYDARTRACSTEAFCAIMCCKHVEKVDRERVNTIALYSMRHNCWKELPPLPNVSRGIRNWAMCVSVKDTLYVLGGGHQGTRYSGSSEVYMMNLTRERSWKRCADMLQPRLRFSCGVKDGKIYVFGGLSLGRPVHRCEVYDPQVNAWCRIKSMNTFRLDSHVTVVGKELVVHSGCLLIDEYLRPGIVDDERGVWLEKYNPAKDQWNSMRMKSSLDFKVFFVKERAYMMSSHGIFLYNFDKKVWNYSQAHSFAVNGLTNSHNFEGVVWPVGNELLATIGSYKWDRFWVVLVQSKGFGIYGKEIMWEEVKWLASYEHLGLIPPLSCSIQL